MLAEFQIGDTVGDYQIVGVLGRGGMGKVFQVRNRLSDRVEAMKVILPGHEEDSWQLFFCEAAGKFHKGAYTAEYEAKLVAEFHKLLPDSPPWKRET